MADHDERFDDQHGNDAGDPTLRDQPDREHGRTRAERLMDDEPTQLVRNPREDERTQVIDTADRTQVIDTSDRTQVTDTSYPTQVNDDAEHTRVLPADQRDGHEAAAEQERLAAARRADDQRRSEAEEQRRRRAEAESDRQRRLGTVTPREEPDVVAAVPPKRVTDRFLGSLGLFLLRLVTAAIMGVHGFQKLTAIEDTTAFFTQLGLPYPEMLAWGVGVAEVLAAVALVFGFLVRFAGLGIAATAIGALLLVRWGAVNPFVAGQSGFVGELELLLAGVGLLFATVGGGGWGLDAGMRRGRARRRAVV